MPHCTLQGVVTEAVAALLVAAVPACATVVLVREQIDAAAAAARATIVLPELVAATAVVGAGCRVHALPAAARRARASRSEAHGGRLLGASAVRWCQRRRVVDRAIGKQEPAPPGSLLATCRDGRGCAGIGDRACCCGGE